MPDKQNENKDHREFIDRNMYQGTSSTKPWLPLVTWGAIGLALFGFGFWQYSAIKDATAPGKTIKVDPLTDTLYSLTGNTGVLIGWGVIGLCAFIFGYQQYHNKIK